MALGKVARLRLQADSEGSVGSFHRLAIGIYLHKTMVDKKCRGVEDLPVLLTFFFWMTSWFRRTRQKICFPVHHGQRTV
jgi:hypothetical protein